MPNGALSNGFPDRASRPGCCATAYWATGMSVSIASAPDDNVAAVTCSWSDSASMVIPPDPAARQAALIRARSRTWVDPSTVATVDPHSVAPVTPDPDWLVTNWFPELKYNTASAADGLSAGTVNDETANSMRPVRTLSVSAEKASSSKRGSRPSTDATAPARSTSAPCRVPVSADRNSIGG